MLLAGTNITDAADKLKKITVDYLYYGLRNPKADVASRIRQLRIIRNIDNKQYAALKRQLPYIVCGIFNPLFRNKENFAYIEYFIVDIDHLSEKGLNLKETRKRIEQNEQVVLSFLSPSEDGLKVMFHLKERCYDANIYTLFYKTFVHRLSTEYNLEQVIDSKTNDVSRACFISMDSEVYYRPDAQRVDLSHFINISDVCSMFDLKHRLDKTEIKNDITPKEEEKAKDPEEEVMNRIKTMLNPRRKIPLKEKKAVYVPERLNEIIDQLKTYIEQTGVVLYEIINIQYAKKLRFKNGSQLAEINLFYGKHGFSVVQSPRCGTSSELNRLMADLISDYISNIS